jgi:transposase
LYFIEMPVDREELLKLCKSNPEAVVELVVKMDARIVELEAEVARLNTQIAELKALLGQNSRNSSRPPSTDVFTRPKSLRGKGEKPPGGQKGHPGCTLRQVEVPDHVIDHKVVVCDKCGASLVDVPMTGVEKRQVFEVPPMKILVTEHRAEIKQCPCCQEYTRARFPGNVLYPVQYGEYLKAFVVYLLIFQFVPYDRIEELFRDLFNHTISKGTLVHIVKSCHERLASVEDIIHRLLEDANVVHVDETGFRATGRRQWLHVASTRLVTWYGHHQYRGLIAMRAFGILSRVTGTLVHDFWKPYLYFRCAHAICNAHLIRELQGISETFHQTWSGMLKELLLQIKKTVDDTRPIATGLEEWQIADYESKYQEIIRLGELENPVPGTRKRGKRGPRRQSKAKNLLDRCKDYQKEVLAFMYDFNIPFDNNQAERDIRMVKLQQKISGTSRSDNGAQWFCRIRAYISTLRKNDQPILSSIAKAFEGHPYIPQTTN